MVDTEVLVLLVLVAGTAGFVDAIAGGGGLLVLPALLAAGLGPTAALATNKLQASFGSGSAALHFTRRGAVDPRTLAPAIATTFVGAAVGTVLVQQLDTSALEVVLPVLLLALAGYVLLGRDVGARPSPPRVTGSTFAGTVAPGIGFYDGFFGPGTGSFFAVAFVSLRGMDLTRATAHTKVLNFTSNVAALLFFVLGGKPVWAVGLGMALGQLVGARLGAHVVLAHGARVVRPLLAVVSIAISLRLLLD